MNSRIQSTLDYCYRSKLPDVVLAVPFQLSLEETLMLTKIDILRGMILYNPPPELCESSSVKWLNHFVKDGDWDLPESKGQLVFVGSHLMISRRMAMKVLRSGRTHITCKINGTYQPLKIYRFLLWKIGDRLRLQIRDLPHKSILRKCLFRLADIPAMSRFWRTIFKREGVVPGQGLSGFSGEVLYAELFRRAQLENKQINGIPGRILLINAGLAAGGAERQIVNTLIGLRDSGQCESVALLAEYIDHAPNLDFFLPELKSQRIEVSQIQQTISLSDDGLSFLTQPIAELLADLPGSIIEEILNLVEEFKVRRPSIVHAWQDSTSIKVGIAAVIVGIPRIFLTSRNVAPMNFTYFQEYMYPAYRALEKLDNVTFLNNSQAGALDYARWLNLPPERFIVLRNGVDLSYLKRPEPNKTIAYKQAMNIPEHTTVVGSIFRFWAEKRPMLWLETAEKIIKNRPDTHFLVIGEGPMRTDMETFILSRGLSKHIHLPGTRPEIALPLSAIDIFLLTSEFEGTPNVVLEAQWFGLPVIATDSGGTREAFVDGVTGGLAKSTEAHIISNLVLGFLNNPGKYERAFQQGPRYVTARFGLERMVKKTLDLYGLSVDSKVDHFQNEALIEKV